MSFLLYYRRNERGFLFLVFFHSTVKKFSGHIFISLGKPIHTGTRNAQFNSAGDPVRRTDTKIRPDRKLSNQNEYSRNIWY